MAEEQGNSKLIKCRWEKRSNCPFNELPKDPRWCQACVAITSAREQGKLTFSMRMQFIAHLIQTYRDEKKAKEVYEQLKKHALKW